MDLLINIDVDDLDKATAFYEKALGLRVGRRFEFGVELVGASSPIYLLVKREGTTASSTTDDTRRYRRHWTPVHLDFVVEDIEHAVQRAIKAGATQESDVLIHDYGRVVYMADPFGHGICLVQFEGRGYDGVALSNAREH